MNQVKGIFGLGMEDYIGKIAFPAVQVRRAALMCGANTLLMCVADTLLFVI
jgi:hypothetical protein